MVETTHSHKCFSIISLYGWMMMTMRGSIRFQRRRYKTYISIVISYCPTSSNQHVNLTVRIHNHSYCSQGANFRDMGGVIITKDNVVQLDPSVERATVKSGNPLVQKNSTPLLWIIFFFLFAFFNSFTCNFFMISYVFSLRFLTTHCLIKMVNL